MALASLFSRFKARKPDPTALAAVRGWALAALGAPDSVTLAINEIDCNDPACPGVETVILIMAPGAKTKACKIGKRVEDVRPADIAQALQAVHSNG